MQEVPTEGGVTVVGREQGSERMGLCDTAQGVAGATRSQISNEEEEEEEEAVAAAAAHTPRQELETDAKPVLADTSGKMEDRWEGGPAGRGTPRGQGRLRALPRVPKTGHEFPEIPGTLMR